MTDIYFIIFLFHEISSKGLFLSSKFRSLQRCSENLVQGHWNFTHLNKLDGNKKNCEKSRSSTQQVTFKGAFDLKIIA